MITRRTALAGLAGALASPAIVAAQTAKPLVVRFGFANVGVDNRQFSGGSALAVAHAEHYFEKELADSPNVRIEYFFFKGAGPAVNEAFANSQLDFASQGDLPQVVGRANGLKTRQLGANGAHGPMYLAVPAKSELRSVKELKGRKVSIFRGTNNHLAAVKVLAANGLTERDLQGINMDEASTNAALATGNIDAAFGNFGLLLLERQGLAKIIYTTKGDNPTFERQGNADRRRWLRDEESGHHAEDRDRIREGGALVVARGKPRRLLRDIGPFRTAGVGVQRRLLGAGAQVPELAADRRLSARAISHAGAAGQGIWPHPPRRQHRWLVRSAVPAGSAEAARAGALLAALRCGRQAARQGVMRAASLPLPAAGVSLPPAAVALLFPAFLLVLWSLAARLGWLPPQILPAPDEVGSALLELARSGDLARDTGISLLRVVEGFAAGCLLGMLLGVAMGLSPTVEDYVRPSSRPSPRFRPWAGFRC